MAADRDRGSADRGSVKGFTGRNISGFPDTGQGFHLHIRLIGSLEFETIQDRDAN